MSNNGPSENPYEGSVTEEKLETIRSEISSRRLFVYFSIVGLIGLGAVRTSQLLMSDNQGKYSSEVLYPAPFDTALNPSVQPSVSAGNGLMDANSANVEGGGLSRQPEFKDNNHCANLDWDSCSIKNGLPADVRESLTKLENDFIQKVTTKNQKKESVPILKERNSLLQPHKVKGNWQVKVIGDKDTHYIRYRLAR